MATQSEKILALGGNTVSNFAISLSLTAGTGMPAALRPSKQPAEAYAPDFIGMALALTY
jgi:hypothetical protein